MSLLNRLFGKKSLTPAPKHNGWIAFEHFTGAWQHNQELKRTDLLSYYAVFSCLTLISTDVGKLIFYPQRKTNGVWQNVESKTSKLLKKPNNFQTWQQFIESWINAKTTRGNAYIFKQRDIFGDIWQLIVLNPDRVTPMISDSGEVFYQISRDKLAGVGEMIVPSSEIIHDRYNCLYHPLVGLSPIMACALSAGQGMAIQANATALFKNASRPSGILSVPQPVSEEKAKDIKKRWQTDYSGLNQGGMAVLGDGAKYESISISSADAQMIEQLKMTGEVVCSVFHVPAFKVGAGTIPGGQKVGDLNEIYYSDCLQHYIEAIENLLNSELEAEDGVEFTADIKSLIRMDSTSQMDYLTKGTGSGIIAPNEARAEIGLKPVIGGDSPLMQQQNYSLLALAKRDSQDDPFASKKPTFDSLYKGIFDPNRAYMVGDFVTKKGGLWHCNQDCQGEFNHQNWTLVSKNGGEKCNTNQNMQP